MSRHLFCMHLEGGETYVLLYGDSSKRKTLYKV